MKRIVIIACIILKSAWQAVSLRSALTTLLLAPLTLLAQGTIQLATFRCDVTPPVGAPLCGGLVKPVASVSEPLLALGVVILGADKPIVLCAVDSCEIRGADHVRWCAQLARAAGTTPDHVAVQSLQQHNAPIANSAAQSAPSLCLLKDLLAVYRLSIQIQYTEWKSHLRPPCNPTLLPPVCGSTF